MKQAEVQPAFGVDRIRCVAQSNAAAMTNPAQAVSASTTKSSSRACRPGAPELRQFKHGNHHDRDRRDPRAVAGISEAEREPDQDESESVLAVLAEIGMRPIACRPQCCEGDRGRQ